VNRYRRRSPRLYKRCRPSNNRPYNNLHHKHLRTWILLYICGNIPFERDKESARESFVISDVREILTRVTTLDYTFEMKSRALLSSNGGAACQGRVADMNIDCDF